MEHHSCQCVFPSPSEEELVTLPSPDGRSAIRAFVEPGLDGYVRLQQLAHDPGLGWYVQKSFVIPGDLLRELIPQLRKAQCLIPGRSRIPMRSGALVSSPGREAEHEPDPPRLRLAGA